MTEQHRNDIERIAADVAADALARAQAGALLGPTDLMAILDIKKTRYHELEKIGAFDHLRVRPAIGPKCFSGTLVWRWLQGQPVFEPSFGRTRVRR